MTDLNALAELQKSAGLSHLPTQLTYEARNAPSGRGPRAADWEDKPHRLVYDLCKEIERRAAASSQAGVLAMLKTGKFLAVCASCAENNAEGCGHFDCDTLRQRPDGEWTCESCWDDDPQNDVRWIDLPAIDNIEVQAGVETAPSAPSDAVREAIDPWVDTRLVTFDATIVFGHGGLDFDRWEGLRSECHTRHGSFAIWKSGRHSWSIYGGKYGLLALDRYSSERQAKEEVSQLLLSYDNEAEAVAPALTASEGNAAPGPSEASSQAGVLAPSDAVREALGRRLDACRENISALRERHRQKMNRACDAAEKAAAEGDMSVVSINSTESERHREAFSALNAAINIFDSLYDAALTASEGNAAPESGDNDLCDDCPPVGYPTDKMRCLPCPRRMAIHAGVETATPASNEPVGWQVWHSDGWSNTHEDNIECYREKGIPVRPIYTHPTPAPSGNEALRKALEFYANEWHLNGDGDSETPGLSRTWMEPTEILFADEGRKARAALSTPAPAQPNTDTEDAIVTDLYRRFKDWSKRGFGPDDVTWCEVKADVRKMIAQHVGAPAQQAVDVEAVAKHLAEARRLFGKIRGDFLDPRDWCDDGRDEIDKALALINGGRDAG